MKTWSIAGALDGLRKLEKLTRPPKLGHDVDTPLDCADALADREAEEDVAEPGDIGINGGLPLLFGHDVFLGARLGLCPGCMLIGGLDPNCATCEGRGTVPQEADERVVDNVRSVEVTIGEGKNDIFRSGGQTYDTPPRPDLTTPRAFPDPGTGCIDDGAPQQVTLSGREYERYLCGALNEPTARMLDDDGAPIHLPESTLDDAVAQLAQLTYFAEDIRNLIITSLSPAAFTPGAGDTAADSVAPPAESAAIPNRLLPRQLPAGCVPTPDRVAAHLFNALHNSGFDYRETAQVLLSDFTIRTK